MLKTSSRSSNPLTPRGPPPVMMAAVRQGWCPSWCSSAAQLDAGRVENAEETRWKARELKRSVRRAVNCGD